MGVDRFGKRKFIKERGGGAGRREPESHLENRGCHKQRLLLLLLETGLATR